MMRLINMILPVLAVAVFAATELHAQKCESGNCKNGKGAMLWTDVRYDGYWKNGNMEGAGTMEWKEGKTYKGRWKAGTFNGHGKLTWNNGDVYEGNFINGKMEGSGKMRWKSGDRYEGQWRNDTMNGRGTMRYASGMTVKGEWKDGLAVTESKKDAANAAMAGPWQLFCKCTPREGDIFDCPGTKYLFTADGKGTFITKGGDETKTGAIQWTLKNKVLSIAEFPEGTKIVNGPFQYSFNAAKNWYTEKKKPYGPEQKKMVVCVVKRGTAD